MDSQDVRPKPGRGRARAPIRGRSLMAPSEFPPSSRGSIDFSSVSQDCSSTEQDSDSSSLRLHMGTQSVVSPSEISYRFGSNSSYEEETSVYSSGSSVDELSEATADCSLVSSVATTGVVQTINPGFVKYGLDGKEVRVVTNYYTMNQTPKECLYQYRVDFSPVEDKTDLKKAVLRQHESTIGAYIFDGSMLYKSNLLPEQHHSLVSKKKNGDVAYTISLRLVAQVNPDDSMFIQFYNIVMRKVMTILGMEEMGRNLYDRRAAIRFPEERLELWPGFITAIRNHMDGTLLCVEVTHKVLRTCTVWDVIRGLRRPEMTAEQYEKVVRAELEDTIVMTHYNRKTYRVTNIDFTANPASSFRKQDGELIQYAKYYKDVYDLVIPQDLMEQPMLVSPSTKKDNNKGITGDIYLVPSLCNPTGLNDDMRKNFTLMKKLSAHLHMGPSERKNKLDDFMKKLKNNPAVRKEFSSWDVDFNSEALETTARVFPREMIIVQPEDRDPIQVDEKGDWTRPMKGRQVLVPVHLRDWLMFVPRADKHGVTNFLVAIKKMAAELGIEVVTPKDVIAYDVAGFDERVLKSAHKTHGETVQLVFFLLPNNQLGRYSVVKSYCSRTWGVASQCFLYKNTSSKNLHSICSKVMIQINAKLGGIPWGIKIPFKKLMVLGFDVYHCSARKGESVGGLVATTSPALTSYISVVSFHKDKSELSSNMCKDMSICLLEYRSKNGFLPDRIVMYRDGVGEGQVAFVLDHEVAQVRVAIKDIYSGTEEALPKLTFIIVTKKINSRAFLIGARGYGNLGVGTVMDRTFTLPERYDFFMVSQDVRQGTVSPTNYNVIFDQSGITADKMQRLAYKMCHLYFNWSGTVAVPAPCQYAHKLAYLTGVAVNDKVAKGLYTKLWYL